MKLSARQISYLRKRQNFISAWRYVGPLLVLAVVGIALYLYLNTPLLINPYEVVSRIDSGAIEPSALEFMAVLLPVMFIIVCFLLIMLVALSYAAFSNEKKYLKIVHRLESNASGEPGSGMT